jgi:lipooligosaccharide transport system ATP-binding protein
MQRRLSLVRALINRPELLILDEPTTGLDPQARQLIWQRLRALRARGMTLVLTSHYMEEAERLCDRVTVMDHGRFLDSDHPKALIQKHIEPQVIEVYGAGLERWHDEVAVTLAERSEQVGETIFYYMHDEKALLAALGEKSELSFLHRPANLEDVFVKLTGRELRDN